MTNSSIDSLSSEDLIFYEECLIELSANSSPGANPLWSGLRSDDSAPDTTRTSMLLLEGSQVSNACLSILEYKKNPITVLSETTVYTIIIVYSCLIILGMVANLSVCWVVMRHSQARTARNLFIINLALSDLTVCFITMPFTMLRLVNHTSWNYGDGLCRLTSLLEGVNLLVSSGTASAIAGDRLCLVRRKTARHDDTKAVTIGLVLLLIWSVSIMAILPTAFFTGTHDITFPQTKLVLSHVCTEHWPAVWAHLAYSVALMVIQYIIPISVILVTHTQIIAIVQKRTRTMTSSRGSLRAEVTMRRNKKTTQILLIIAAAFGVHWLPFHLYTIIMEVMHKTYSSWGPEVELVSFFVVHSFAMLNTITNPILYGWLNTNLTHLFRAMIPHVKNDSRTAMMVRPNINHEADRPAA